MKTTTLLLLSAFGAAGAIATATAEDVVANDAATNWSKQCARCHAADGSGDTKPGRKLKLKDYRDAAVQATFTDEEILRYMVEGVTDDKGKKSMPAYTDKLSQAEMEALVPFVRSLAAPQG